MQIEKRKCQFGVLKTSDFIYDNQNYTVISRHTAINDVTGVSKTFDDDVAVVEVLNVY
jgi:hypothetical protein